MAVVVEKSPIIEVPLDQVNPFKQTLEALKASLQAWGNFKRHVKDLNIISFSRKMNAGIRENRQFNSGASPSLVITPSDIDVTQMLAFTSCSGQIVMNFDFTLFDKGNKVDDILQLVWELFRAVNQYGPTMGLTFILNMQWQVGAIGQANDAGIFEEETEGWATLLPLTVMYSISKENLNINTK